MLAEFATSIEVTDLSAQQLARARDAITDGVGVALAGATQPAVDRAMAVFGTDSGGASVLGRRRRLPAGAAALVNGLAVHALDFDDTAHPAYAHPTASLLPALLAADAAMAPLRGHRVLCAYVVGLEVINVLGRLMNQAHYRAGWHPTSTLGTFAATAALANALELDADTATMAMSIAASMSGGVRANFGTMTKPLHAGLAARNAVEAVSLAQAGFTAHADAIGAPFGFLAASGAPAFSPEEVAAQLGPPWELDSEIGLALKPYPSCGATHPGIEAASILGRRITGQPTEVRVGVNSLAPDILTYPRPATGLEAKFSIHYTVSAALERGELTIEDFQDDRVADVVGRGLTETVVMEVDERVRTSTEFATAVRVTTSHGETFEELVPLAMGKPARWPSERDQWKKFSACAAFGPPVPVELVWRKARELLDDRPLGELASAASNVSPR